MAELFIALAPLFALAGLAFAALLLPLAWIAGTALALMALGTLLGVPGGFYYHVVLRRELLRVGRLPRGWFWQPQRHHRLLDHAALRRLRPWFFVGGFGFASIITGALLALTALALWFRGANAMLG